MNQIFLTWGDEIIQACTSKPVLVQLWPVSTNDSCNNSARLQSTPHYCK